MEIGNGPFFEHLNLLFLILTQIQISCPFSNKLVNNQILCILKLLIRYLRIVKTMKRILMLSLHNYIIFHKEQKNKLVIVTTFKGGSVELPPSRHCTGRNSLCKFSPWSKFEFSRQRIKIQAFF